MFPLPLLEQVSSQVSHVNIAALLVFLLVFHLVRFYQKRRHFANIPPGPKPWPVVGNFGGFLVPSFIQRRFGQPRPDGAARSPLVVLTEQAEVYGNVYSLFVGSQLIVVLNGYEVVKDALSNHPEVFSDRPDIPSVTIMTKRKGKAVQQASSLISCTKCMVVLTCQVA